MTPQGEVPQINWPVVTVSGQKLVVRWTFYAQWLLSKRKVNVREMAKITKEMDPALVDILVECFAAAVAENYSQPGATAPDADGWARIVSALPPAEQERTWLAMNTAVWEAILASRKARPAAAAPTPQDPANPGMTPN